jgi:hypothetical protein
MTTRTRATPVYLEVAMKRTFACAVEWPGWCRSGKTEELAIETLGVYAERYSAVVAAAGVDFPSGAGDGFDIVERLSGNATTEFGAPGVVPRVDSTALQDRTAKQFAAIATASWDLLDRVAATAPAELRKGPRGGGRDRDKVVQHVVSAEAGYARMIGVRHREPDMADRAAVAALRQAIIEVIGRASDGSPAREKGWPVRYAARRITWHVLDHVWEIEDRSEP